MKRYNPKNIEPKWQKKWEESGINEATEDSEKPKKYILEFFPYPSGAAMHVGHVRNYTIGDAIVRFNRMRGYNVLHPMGWDAFGLPAENYAIKNKISPRKAIDKNTKRFKNQLTQMGFSYDWSREIDSSDPYYYKWTQYFFTLLFQKGLAYRKESLVNWDPVDKTVLANEQVVNGVADRSGAKVEKIPLPQWFFKITDYADRLIDDLEDLNWSESIKSMQRNWIGKSEGAEVEFRIKNTDQKPKTKDEIIRVFTTRPDTLFGATFMVLAPEHSLVKQITTKEQQKEVENYIKQTEAMSEIERQDTERKKTGVFTGAYAINPVNNEEIPIWIADYVLMGYGTGAIMAVPAHDERDFEFAQKFNIPIKQVIARDLVDNSNTPVDGFDTVSRETVHCIVKHPQEDKYLMLNWPKYNRNTFIIGGVEKNEKLEQAGAREILEETGYKNVRLIRQLGDVLFASYHAPHKSINRRAKVTGLLFELEDLEKEDIKQHEKELHQPQWVELKKLKDTVTTGVEPPIFIDDLLNNKQAYSGEGVVINSGKYDGMSSSEAREKIVADLQAKQAGVERVNYKIRDWLISRQRYWGAPIPVVWVEGLNHDFSEDIAHLLPNERITKLENGKEYLAVALPVSKLPVKLPEMTSYEPDGTGRGPLARAQDWGEIWFNVKTGESIPQSQPKPSGDNWVKAHRETDTMDGFACSSWYFLRFADPHNNKEPFSKESAKFWLPVDDYIGGAEHAVMHLLYARMWTKVMYDAGLINFKEPFKTLRNQGMILAPDGRKMSKSWGNVISPDDLIEQGYGADAIRVMELFIGPWDQQANWSVEGMGGCFRFLQRVWIIAQEYLEAKDKNSSNNNELTVLTHKTIAKVSKDIDELGFNTAISALMEMINLLYKIKADEGFSAKEWKSSIETLLKLLAPFAPHVAEELWSQLGNKQSIHISDWPVHDEKYLSTDNVTIVVQVNGKVRANIEVSRDSNQDEVEQLAKKQEKIANYTKDVEVKKVIYVPNKLINFVIG